MAADVYQLKVTVHQSKPPIWRRLLVPGDATLADLHAVLQIAFRWQNYHLHQFTVAGVYYAVPSPEDFEPVRASSSAVLLLGGAVLLIAALLLNWMVGTAIGHLASVPEHGFIGAESRFEGLKLNTAVERYRFLAGAWPTSLDKVSSEFALSRAERASSLGVDYGYRAGPNGYSLWLRDESPEPGKAEP